MGRGLVKIIEIVADVGHTDTIAGIASQYEVTDLWVGQVNPDGRISTRLLVDENAVQTVLDMLQTTLGASENTRLLLLPVEASLPKPVIDKEEEKRRTATVSREALYDRVAKGAQLDSNYFVLVFLSTIVVAIGLIEDNVAGMVLTFSLSVVAGYLLPVNLDSHELLARTHVNLETVALALASGAAAVLSLTTGLPSVLVGAMVAVALLPPTATVGLMLSGGLTLMPPVPVCCLP